jgi:hypothetical protein
VGNNGKRAPPLDFISEGLGGVERIILSNTAPVVYRGLPVGN